jgi:Protein of unknown function (DUF3152)
VADPTLPAREASGLPGNPPGSGLPQGIGTNSVFGMARVSGAAPAHAAVRAEAGDVPADPARRRSGWVVVALAGVLVLIAGGVSAYLIRQRPMSSATVLPPSLAPAVVPTATPTPSPTPSSTPSSTPVPTGPPSYAMNGPGTYAYASGGSGVVGSAGGVRTYRVGVENGVPVPVADFAAMVDRTLGDPRSWIAGNNVRLQRVSGETAGFSFTVVLVSPGTAQKLCGAVGLDIFWRGEPYSSCQAGAKAVINLSRYLKAVPDYGAPLADYQQYAINHEVGHVLGHGHELCPAKGQPAPVMQQQTFSLQGCVANSWPYLDGKRYAGPPGRIVPPN